jgi:hypothetical protein
MKRRMIIAAVGGGLGFLVLLIIYVIIIVAIIVPALPSTILFSSYQPTTLQYLVAYLAHPVLIWAASAILAFALRARGWHVVLIALASSVVATGIIWVVPQESFGLFTVRDTLAFTCAANISILMAAAPGHPRDTLIDIAVAIISLMALFLCYWGLFILDLDNVNELIHDFTDYGVGGLLITLAGWLALPVLAVYFQHKESVNTSE